MHRFKNIFNYFFILGVCPFYIQQNQVKVSRFYSAVTTIKTFFFFAAYIYTIFVYSDYFTHPDRVDVSFLAIVLGVVTIALDFIFLEICLIVKQKAQKDLFLKYTFIKETVERLAGSLSATEKSRIERNWRRTTHEITVKSIYLIPIPIVAASLISSDIHVILCVVSFVAMLYSILFQFIHNRLFLIIFYESLELYHTLIKATVSSLPPEMIVKIIRQFHEGIRSYNKTFKFQNLVLIQTAFVTLLLLLYVATAMLTKIGPSVSLALAPAIIQISHDVGIFIYTCHSINSKIKAIKATHSRHLKVDGKSGTVRIFFFLTKNIKENNLNRLIIPSGLESSPLLLA